MPLVEPVSVYHVQAKPGAGPIFGTFLAAEQKNFFLKRPRFWNHFGSIFLGREHDQGTTFCHWLDYLAAQVWPEKMSADETNLSRVGAKKAVGHIVSKRWWPTVHVSIRSSFWLAVAARLNWAGRRWVRTLKRTFGIAEVFATC